MSAAHTPGPWKVRVSHNGALRGYSIEREDENALLIAAAPELIEALELALETIYGQAELLRACGAAYGIGATLQRATEAIAKAKGGAA